MIGRRFVFDGRAYRLKLDAAETKSGCPYVAAAPHELAPYMDLWLEVYGVQLIARAEDRGEPPLDRPLGQAHEQQGAPTPDLVAH